MSSNEYRMTPQEYSEHSSVVKEFLFNEYFRIYNHRIYVSIPASYADKSSFGDIDLVIGPSAAVGEDSSVNRLANRIEHVLHSEGVRSINLVITSIKANVSANSNQLLVEVELSATNSSSPIKTSLDIRVYPTFREANFASSMLSLNGAMSLAGPIARNLGFKLKDTGLYYPLNYKGQISDILVTNYSTFDAFNALGWDDEVSDRMSYRAHIYQTLEEVFEDISKSSYFNHEYYLPENNTSYKKSLSKKTECFKRFVVWREENLSRLQNREVEDTHRSDLLKGLLTIYPSFEERYRNFLKGRIYEESVSSLYNGNIISAITGAKGPDIAVIKATVLKEFGSKALLEQALFIDPNSIREAIIRAASSYFSEQE